MKLSKGPRGISKLTVLVPVLDSLFRFAHKLSQNSFESLGSLSKTLTMKVGDGGCSDTAARTGHKSLSIFIRFALNLPSARDP